METDNEDIVINVFRNTIIKHIEDNNTKELFSILHDPEICPLLKTIFPPSWPDFMQPYVERFGDEVDDLYNKSAEIDVSTYVKIGNKFNDYCAICLDLELRASYGYLMGKVMRKIGRLMTKLNI